MMEFIVIVLILVFAGVGVMGSSYRGLQRRRSELDDAFAGLDLQFKRRWEIIPTLVQSVQGYLEDAAERKKLEGVFKYRDEVMGEIFGKG